ncbi:multicopper oxidase domain-containing protein [Cyclobacterium roseum]|uniref:multicopper oxidase domain-containing protein n=1 Tax=Cyclobacterium roseum TaxID=2666137 RepID=UPI001391D167|nr:multicopper oxidase domain-containing protein [Cyclobacterium roseum]
MFALSHCLLGQTDTIVYRLTIDQKVVNKAGKKVNGMTINGNIPGPTLTFKEGDYAVIFVENKMDVETSVHWHGLLLPNFYDGVPYLTTPPIKPGETFKYEYPLIQSGTYWYHSHTLLQEQSGVYGSIVIDSKQESLEYDSDLVLVISDWTNQKPMNVLRNLKRGNEWYGIKKGTSTPLSMVIARGGIGAQLNFWRQRMEGADIADIYYPAFLMNGEQNASYPEFHPRQKVRLRIINASASSQYWLTFGGNDPLLVAADGPRVVPVEHNKTFFGIAETYDFIVTIPDEGQIEVRASVQDGSGQTSAFLGTGDTLSAPDVPQPDKIAMMKEMAKMKMRMGAPAMKFNPSDENPYKLRANWGMDGNMDHKMDESEMSDTSMKHAHQDGMQTDGKMEDGEMGMFSEYNYDYLKAVKNTDYPEEKPVKEVLLNLTGNMWRYIWSFNGVPLSEADKISIEKGQVVQITLNNLTMMHHPMHLHGHFFRVINKNGDRSPLKHTVNVPPMQSVKIEFDANEDSDWFFHCHVLYHMLGGMARVYSYDTPRDPRMEEHPVANLIHETDKFYSWGLLDAASHMIGLNLVTSNTRNQFNLNLEYGWNQIAEAEVTYERYLYDYLRVFGGVNVENETENKIDKAVTTAVVGIRFFTPYMFDLDVRIDHLLRPQIGLEREIMILPRTVLFGEIEYQADFGLVNDINEEENLVGNGLYNEELVWNAGLEYFLSRNFSLMASYDNRFGAGGGLSVRF